MPLDFFNDYIYIVDVAEKGQKVHTWWRPSLFDVSIFTLSSYYISTLRDGRNCFGKNINQSSYCTLMMQQKFIISTHMPADSYAIKFNCKVHFEMEKCELPTSFSLVVTCWHYFACPQRPYLFIVFRTEVLFFQCFYQSNKNAYILTYQHIVGNLAVVGLCFGQTQLDLNTYMQV